MRIVAGRHRGRRIVAPTGLDLRPTADRARQALFDILEHGGLGPTGESAVRAATVLDAFCGTGALAFEALSRGAEHATLIDTSEGALKNVRETARTLEETDQILALRRDATDPGPGATRHTLAFLDPPYGSGLAWTALAALRRQNWLSPDALAIVEVGSREEIPPLGADLELLRERRYGNARVVFLRLLSASAAS